MNKFNAKILDRYIFSQDLAATIMGILIFIIVWISPEILFRIIRQVVYGEISAQTGLNLFFFEIPEVLGKAIPVGLMIGSLFVFDRLSRNFELIVMRSIGISFARTAFPVLILGFASTIMCFHTYDSFIPHSTARIKEIKNEKPNIQYVYVDKLDNGKPKQAIIVASFDGKIIDNINVLRFSESLNANVPLLKDIINAPRAKYVDNQWIVEQGTLYNVSEKGIYEEIEKVENKVILSGDTAQKAFGLMKYATKEDKELSTCDIKNYLTLLKSENLQEEYNYMLNKFYQRYSQAFSCIVFAIAGVVLGWSKPRQNRFLGFTIGAGIIFVYYLVIPFLDLLAEKGILYPSITAWLPFILISAGIWFYAIRQK